MSTRFYLITGCSGGGKSTLLQALAEAGHAVVPEPGRRVLAAERASDSAGLPWVDMAAFAQAAVRMARLDLETAKALQGPVFFDRGLIDAAVALHHAARVPLAETLGKNRHYADTVFLAPPWPELFETDTDRRHRFEDAVAEYNRLAIALQHCGRHTLVLPKDTLPRRMAFVLDHIQPFE